MRLIHLTDPHLSHLRGIRWTQLRGKRRSGFASWLKNRRKIYLPEVLARLCDAVKSENADQILVTGDLVQIGLESEIQQAAQWLTALGTPDQVMLVPGNHDVYAKGSETLVNQLWGDFMFTAQPGAGQPHSWPTQRKHGPLTLIGLSTACVSPVFMATGKLDDAQLKALPGLLKQAREEGQLVAVLIHHPPLPGMSEWRKSLLNHAELQAILAEQPPDLMFYGHMHHNLETLWHGTHLYCTAAASDVVKASYRVVDIQDQEDHFQLKMTLKGIDSTQSGQGKIKPAEVHDAEVPGELPCAGSKATAGFVTLDSNSWSVPKQRDK